MSVWLWSPTFIISSFVSFSAILLAISCMKASKLSRPELSLSTWEGRLVCKKDNQELPTNLWDHFLDLFFSWFKSKSPHGNFQIFGVNHPLACRVKKAATGRCQTFPKRRQYHLKASLMSDFCSSVRSSLAGTVFRFAPPDMSERFENMKFNIDFIMVSALLHYCFCSPLWLNSSPKGA